MDLEHIDRWQVATVLTFHEDHCMGTDLRNYHFSFPIQSGRILPQTLHKRELRAPDCPFLILLEFLFFLVLMSANSAMIKSNIQ
jgi:hypothetical protein